MAENGISLGQIASGQATLAQMSRNDHGSDAAEFNVQSRLADLGYYPSEYIDGWFGPVTEQAVRDFQAANGLEVTGEVDAATLEAMNSPDAASASQAAPASGDAAPAAGSAEATQAAVADVVDSEGAVENAREMRNVQELNAANDDLEADEANLDAAINAEAGRIVAESGGLTSYPEALEQIADRYRNASPQERDAVDAAIGRIRSANDAPEPSDTGATQAQVAADVPTGRVGVDPIASAE
jgi:hypothetical protein